MFGRICIVSRINIGRIRMLRSAKLLIITSGSSTRMVVIISIYFPRIRGDMRTCCSNRLFLGRLTVGTGIHAFTGLIASCRCYSRGSTKIMGRRLYSSIADGTNLLMSGIVFFDPFPRGSMCPTIACFMARRICAFFPMLGIARCPPVLPNVLMLLWRQVGIVPPASCRVASSLSRSRQRRGHQTGEHHQRHQHSCYPFLP